MDHSISRKTGQEVKNPGKVYTVRFHCDSSKINDGLTYKVWYDVMPDESEPDRFIMNVYDYEVIPAHILKMEAVVDAYWKSQEKSKTSNKPS